MVKQEERTRAYHPRAPHKPECMCAPCKTKRGVGEVLPPEAEVIAAPAPPPPPAMVNIGSLRTKRQFEYNGQRYRVGEMSGEVAVCAQLVFRNNGPDPADQYWGVQKTVSLGYATLVQPL